MMQRRTGLQGQRGYSLAEMIVVVAIIGIFSLVAVPQFMKMNQGMKVKASMRQFATDIRAARQRAITRNRRHAITITTGANPSSGIRGQYEIWERGDDGTWSRVTEKKLTHQATDVIYFASTDFANATDGGNVGGDTRPDIVFLGNGTIANMPSGSNARVVLKTNWTIAKNTFTYRFTGSGNFVTESN